VGEVRIVLAGSGPFGIPSFERVYKIFDVIGVITQVDKPKGRGYLLCPTPVASWAEGKGLRVWKLSSIKEFSPIGDLLLIIDCGFIIPRNIIEAFPKGVIALHPSLLPKYRGPDPIRRVLLAGERETGVTTFFVNEKVDAGDIILQRKVEIGERWSYGELFTVLSEEGAKLVEETLSLLESGNVIRKPQSEEDATYAPKLKKEKRIIDWRKPSLYIDRLIRALSPTPGALTTFRGRILKVLEAEPVVDEFSGASPGEILGVDRRGIIVSAGEGALCLKRVQPEGKKVMLSSEFCCGYKPLRGEILGK